MRTSILLIVCMAVVVSASSFAQSGRKSAQNDGKVTVIFTQEVKDYTQWRKVYDENTRGRKSSRVKITGVYTDAKNPNMVTVIAQFPNAAYVDSLTSNPRYKSALDDAGVVGSPDIKVLRMMANQ
ncbi:MAG: hypothetical protein ACM3Q4_12045 [Acidobacteriota bacterium]